jgi:hypothetical protein
MKPAAGHRDEAGGGSRAAATATASAAATSLHDDAVVALTGRALRVWHDVRAGWSLDPASLELLRCACESLQRADEAAAIVTREGQVVRDRWGQVRPHPAALLERDHRAQASRSLQVLGVSLETS